MDKPTLVMLCGLPASGKSTYADKLKLNMSNKTIILSSDAIREELYGNKNTQGNSEEIFALLHKRAKENLNNGINVIYDATNINSKKRKNFLSTLKGINCNKCCTVIATPYRECLENNQNRNRIVPEEVIKKMYMTWNTPYWFEGWDSISIELNSRCNMKKSLFSFVDSVYYLDQENHYHSKTLGEHCEKVGNNLHTPLLKSVGFLHDCGKPFTKSYINNKGEVTKEAHYYNHQNVGAYNSLFYTYQSGIELLDVSILINLHMYPCFWEEDKNNGEKLKEKCKRLWGNDLYNNVIKLHEADVKAY